MPAGVYRAKAALPRDLKELPERDGTTRRERFIASDSRGVPFDGASYLITSLGSVRGRITSRYESKPPQQYLELIPVDSAVGEAKIRLLISIKIAFID